MSLNSTLYTGVSGLSAYGNAISVIGNNIANVNTTGFKESRGNFSDVLSRSSGTGGTLQIGRGVLVSSVSSVFTQGAFQSTSLPGDLAIDGDGFFIVKDPQTNALLYTRNGNFALNRDGKLANPDGLIAQGFNVDSSGNALPLVEDINISGQSFPPKQSANATIQVNLDSASPLIPDPINPGTVKNFDPADPVKTSQFSTALTVYDSLGTGHTVDIYFQKTADNNWNWFTGTRANELAGQTGTSLVVVGSGTLTFTNDGALDTVNTTFPPPAGPGATATFNFAGGAQPGQTINFNFGTPGFEGTTQFAAPSSTLLQSQDGYGSGVLQNFSIDDQGKVRGLFSNGQALDLKRVALAKFASTAGLKSVGKNLFSETLLSGQPIVASPGNSGTGSLHVGSPGDLQCRSLQPVCRADPGATSVPGKRPRHHYG